MLPLLSGSTLGAENMAWQDDHQKRVDAMPVDVRGAHRHSSNHRSEILASSNCGCFYCRSTFPPTAILDWVDEDPNGVGQTALCPRCGIDSVIGDLAGYALSLQFLADMQAYWF